MLYGVRGVSRTVGLGLSAPSFDQQEFIQTLLFVSPPGTLSEALAAAIEREFPWLAVRHVPDLHLACAKFDEEVQLVLVDLRYLNALEIRHSELVCMHPSASIAIVGDVSTSRSADLIQIMDTQRVRGILPMNVNLDLLLSILHILLRGGEYFPPALYHWKQFDRGNDDGAAEIKLSYGERRPRSETMEDLTEREMEILSRVAKGNQNKIIAGDLGLSEHTVKIHIHNIITKLGVHNRTEAAAIYFERASAMEKGEARHAANRDRSSE